MTKKKSPPVETAQSVTSIESDVPYFDDDPSKEDVPPLNTSAEVKDGQLAVKSFRLKALSGMATDPLRDPDLVDPGPADPPADPDPSAGSGQALAQVISDDQLALKDLPTNATLQDALITLDVKPGDVFASRVNLQTGQVTIVTKDGHKFIYPPNN